MPGLLCGCWRFEFRSSFVEQMFLFTELSPGLVLAFKVNGILQGMVGFFICFAVFCFVFAFWFWCWNLNLGPPAC